MKQESELFCTSGTNQRLLEGQFFEQMNTKSRFYAFPVQKLPNASIAYRAKTKLLSWHSRSHCNLITTLASTSGPCALLEGGPVYLPGRL